MGELLIKEEGLYELNKINLDAKYNSRTLTNLAKEKFKGRTDLVVLEIGVHAGQNLRDMWRNLNPAVLIGIDCWDIMTDLPDRFILETWYRCHGHPEIIIIKGWSQNVAKIIGLQFDFIYIDGSHFPADVRIDIESWLPKMKKDGIFGGHDYNMDGVKQVVNELFPNANNDGAIQGSDWWILT